MGINQKIDFFPLVLGFLLIVMGLYFLYSVKDIKATKNVRKYFSFVKIERLRNLDEYIEWLAKWSKMEAIVVFAISLSLIVDSFFYITVVLDAIMLILLIALISVHLYTRIKTPKFYKPLDTL